MNYGKLYLCKRNHLFYEKIIEELGAIVLHDIVTQVQECKSVAVTTPVLEFLDKATEDLYLLRI